MHLFLRRLFPIRPLTWRGTLVLMGTAWLVPFTVHLLPWTGGQPLGAHLLPTFWAAFVAVYLYGVGGGMVVALTIPLLKFLATDQLLFEHAGRLTLELMVFSALAALAVHRWPALRLIAPLAWLQAKVLVLGLAWALPVFDPVTAPGEQFVTATTLALPGLGVLLALNVALVTLLPKDQDWDTE